MYHQRTAYARQFTSVRRMALAVLTVATMVVAGGVATPSRSASADPISDLRARAAEVSAEISQLEAKIRAATNEVEEAEYRGSQLDEQIAAAEAQLAAAREQEAASRKQLASYALQAYVSGGSTDDMADLLADDAGRLDQRRGYASSAVGDRQELIDTLRASQQRTQDQAAALSASREEARSTAERAEGRRREAQAAADRLAAIRSQLEGDLAKAVAEQQAAEQRAAEQRARAEAEAQLRARASRPAAATPQASGGPAPSSPPVAEQELPPVAAPDAPPPPVAAPNSSAAEIAIAAAQSQIGVPYSWGGGGPSGPTFGIGIGAGTRGFDCSGLTQYAYAQAGVSLAHLTWTQMRQGRVVPLSQIQRGDLVFYWGGGHVALYVGNGQVIHAPRTGTLVGYGSLYMGTPELVVRPTA